MQVDAKLQIAHKEVSKPSSDIRQQQLPPVNALAGAYSLEFIKKRNSNNCFSQ